MNYRDLGLLYIAVGLFVYLMCLREDRRIQGKAFDGLEAADLWAFFFVVIFWPFLVLYPLIHSLVIFLTEERKL